tara:strand:+ start:271 stop:513 length:243 start_codon:yes stop_codon:yes gene_type:complete
MENYQYSLQEEFNEAAASFVLNATRKLTKKEVLECFIDLGYYHGTQRFSMPDGTPVEVMFEGYQYGHSETEVYGEFKEEE